MMKKPLSPHLGIYRWEVTMAASITHRATGVFLWLIAFFGLLLVANDMLYPVINWPDYWRVIFWDAVYYLRLLVVFSLVFHAINGIRHFIWDLGLGYDIKVARLTAWLAFLLALAAAVATFFMV
ncbi:MAG: succinate dehydrogenase, cytochrome b556 subunit [Alphaproteobacteria bacterium]|nr:succinate dehydrogenase, cytochrome b556 subunit [Alphaproteobacteria bacterium]